jgi:hypothetical protein
MKKLVLIMSGLVITGILLAQSPAAFNYQAVVRDATGAVKANQNVSFRISILQGSVSGTAVFRETHSAMTNEFGLVNLEIGNGNILNGTISTINWGGNRHFLKIELDPNGGSSYTPMGTSQLLSVPYALNAKTVEVDQVNDADADPANEIQILQLSGTQLALSKGGGTVTLPSSGGGLTLPYEGASSSSATAFLVTSNGTGSGVKGVANSANATGVVGLATAASGTLTRGVMGETASNEGYGVYGAATSSTGENYGLYGRSLSSAGYGVYGYASKTTGTNYGVYGISRSANGYGVYGYLDNTGTIGSNNAAVYGESNSSTGIGVRGHAPYIGVYGRGAEETGRNYGVFGRSRSADGYGVYGTGPKVGVWGESNASSGFCYGIMGTSVYCGVYGVGSAASTDTYGVIGITESSNGSGVVGKGRIHGVYGEVSATGVRDRAAISGFTYDSELVRSYGGYFVGSVYISNWLYKGGGSFKIDHPLDPENKFLLHSFVESPDMMNIYNGNTVTDGSGYATIVMPDWFEALNMDFRYQLTVIGEFAQAIISKEIQNNTFEVRTDKPNVKVSWQVTGVRHDAFAEKNRMKVEEPKEGDEVGLYLHPYAFGLSSENGIDYQRHKAMMEKSPLPAGSKPLSGNDLKDH